MNENETMDFAEFESAMLDDGYQTAPESEENPAEVTEPTENPSQQEEEQPTEEGSEGQESGQGQPETAPESKDTFTLKVNKQEQQVTREEMIALAQMGMDYDRVKEQSAAHQESLQQLNQQLEELGGLESLQANRGALEILGIISQKNGASLEELAQTLYVSLRRSEGASEEVARQELKNARLERELDGLKASKAPKEEDPAARAQRDLEEFRREYPEVELSQELVEKLMADVQGGMSLTAAYRKYDKAQDTARIQQLQAQIAAQTQNEKNRRSSPGPQTDGGGRHGKDPFGDFLTAFA